MRKFDNGTYGLGDNYGHSIDPTRLEALPQANLCLSCKAHLSSRGGDKDSSEEKVVRFQRAKGKVATNICISGSIVLY